MAKVKATLKKFTSFIALAWRYFCEKTSLPGWRYIVLSRISKVERCVYLLKKNTGDNEICRIFWLLICLSAVIYIFVEIRNHWVNLSLNYTRTLTKSTQHDIYYFLFPAVTICGLNKVSKKAALSLVENL